MHRPNALLQRGFRPTRSSRRGSVLITALIFSAIIALSLASYIRLALNSLRLADRSFYQSAAVNLAEMGLERAIYCYNQLDNVANPAAAWTDAGWPQPANDGSVRRTFSNIPLGPGVTGEVRVYCSSFNPGTGVNPVIVARATVNFPPSQGGSFSKFMEVTLRKRSLFVNGLVAKDSISWVGHPTADSWNSGNPASPTPYSVGARTANCTVGCINGSITLGSGGHVYGYAKTGASGTTSGGSVHGLGSTTNDPSRISNDFSASLPPVVTPTPATVNIIVAGSVPTVFPQNSHNFNVADGKYYYVFGMGTQINDTTNIGVAIPNKNLVFIMNNHANVDAINFTGNKRLNLHTGSTLTIYTNGGIRAMGNGMVNGTISGANPCSSLMIFGTIEAPSTQEIKVGGNGQLYGVIYAPNANVELRGGGNSGMVLGSVVAKTIDMNGGTEFHYDEALGNLTSGNPFGIAKWRELQSAAERNAYANQLSQ